MNEIEVRIVTLEPLQVASAYGFSESPEDLAFEIIHAFAAANNLLHDGELPNTFGFNNPDPSPGSKNYGYEVWLPLSSTVQASAGVKIKDFPGGLYAVNRLRGLQNIGERWQQLVQWCESSKYRFGNHQWLEHLLSPASAPLEEYIFDLYLPVVK